MIAAKLLACIAITALCTTANAATVVVVAAAKPLATAILNGTNSVPPIDNTTTTATFK